MNAPVELDGDLVVRPVPARFAAPLPPAEPTEPATRAERTAIPWSADQDLPPRPEDQDRPWPRSQGDQRPAARPPDLDAIAERVIARLRRQQRLASERRG